MLPCRLYEEVEPAQILEERTVEEASATTVEDERERRNIQRREFLVQYADGRADEWVPDNFIAPDVLEDWEKKLEYAEAETLLDMRQNGTERSFLVKWADGRPVSALVRPRIPVPACMAAGCFAQF